ncbi:hypothetical protein RCL_jg16078.t1 [Rhizophagus clarus]|uniref:Uncharacterized protein n=1 Tax=Rhizophagus clarus TaxID=94130 RepID=A0A8H3LCR7_9GLOM|nr:hypothetical protein RCL_jg16078.t1 [Rhizophagus clarus]
MHFTEATQDYKLMVFFIPGFFEDHEGTNETDYGINDRIFVFQTGLKIDDKIPAESGIFKKSPIPEIIR